MTKTIRTAQARLLSGVGTAVLASMIATGAQAQSARTDVTVLPDPTAIAIGHKTTESVQEINQGVTAGVSNVVGGITGVTDPGTQIGNSNEVEANAIRATATGQTLTNFIDLSLIDVGDDGSTAEGVASLGVQTSQVGASVTSSANANTLSLALDGFQTGSAVNSGNTITATTTVNDAETLIAGSVPSGHVSGVAGTSSLSAPGDIIPGTMLSANGTIVVSSVQRALDPNARAEANGNEITTRLDASADNTITAAPELANNVISSSTKINTASNTASIESGDNPLFNGSAVVSNLQVNEPDDVSVPGAYTTSSRIVAEIGSDSLGVVNTLQGSLTVDGNALTSSASGNEAIGTGGAAGNRILIGDGMSFDGTGSVGSANISAASGDTSNQANADLIINSSQNNLGRAAPIDPELTAATLGSSIEASVQSINEGTLDLNANAITASVRGNNASSAIASGDNAALFDGNVMIANQQTNDAYDLSARVDQGQIAAVVGDEGGSTTNSTVNVSGNTVSAAGYGNIANQDVALSAAALELDVAGDIASLSGSTSGTSAVTVFAGAAIANVQSGTDSSLTVVNSNSQISLMADSQGAVAPASQITGSNLTVGNNRQEAIALGNSAGSSVSLEANDTGTGAGIASVQSLDADSSVSAGLTTAAVGLVAASDVVNGQLAVTNNLQRAIGYGSSATNSVDVTSNQLTSPTTPAPASSIVAVPSPNPFGIGAPPTVVAAFGVMNDQQTQAPVAAIAEGSALTLMVVGDVTASSAVNDGNALVGAAFGNDSNNSVGLAVGNIDSVDGYSAVAAISNTQASAGGVTAVASGGTVVTNNVSGDVSGSSISTSDNAIQALANGNRASGNIVSVSGTNIDTAATSGTAGGVSNVNFIGRALTANASFSVQNAQAAYGTIQASQHDAAVDPTTAAGILTAVDGDLTNSTVVSQGNASSAQATGNSAVSGVNISANDLATTSGVQNYQNSSATLSALIGLEGGPGTPFVAGTPDQPALNVSATGSGTGTLENTGDNLVVTGSTDLIFTGQSFTQREVDFLNSLAGVSGATLNGNTVVLTGTVDMTNFDGFSFGSGADGVSSGDETVSVTGFTVPLIPGTPDQLATPGTPNQGGVTIALGADITASRVAVDGNSTAGSVIGNNAANSLMISANTIADGSMLATSTALDVGNDGATADHALANFQVADGPPIDSAVFGTFAIDGADGALVTDATLSVSDNTQSATAIASTADNTVSLMGNSITAGTALASVQEGFSAVSAETDADLFAPAGVSGSTVALSGNTNSALAVNNDVTNTLSVVGTNVSRGAPDAANLAVGTGDAMATGDHVLANEQNAFAPVVASATTRIFNDDGILDNITGIANSSVTIENNRTSAEGSANRAVNTMAIEGSALLDASAGLANSQVNNGSVNVDATSSATLTMTGAAAGGVPAANGSTAAINGNSTTALARGNTASNALNVTAGSGYGTGVGGSAGSTFDGSQTVVAEAAVLNRQSNNAAVSATSTGATYQMALNSGASNPGLLDSSFAVSGNMVASEAYGNTATNRLTMTSLNSNTPTAAVGNFQVNTGNVIAATTSVTFGMIAGNGGIAGSTLQANGNQISATAVGNSAVSTITGR